MSVPVYRALGYDQSVFIQDSGIPVRRAIAYRACYISDGEPAVWLVRVEKFPEHGEPGSGWYGGQVLWDHRQASRETAEAIAMAWVADAILPGRA